MLPPTASVLLRKGIKKVQIYTMILYFLIYNNIFFNIFYVVKHKITHFA